MKDLHKRKAIINRIKIVFKDLNNRKIAQILNISSVTVGRWFRNYFIPPYDVLIKISNYGKVTLDWLLAGKEPKRISEFLIEKEDKVKKGFYSNVFIFSPDELKAKIQKIEPEESYIIIPMLSNPDAIKDFVNINERNIESYVLVNHSWLHLNHTYRCIRIKDNSMAPILEEGFIVAIDCSLNQPNKLDGKIVAARYKKNIIIRRLVIDDKNYILLPQNSIKHKPITIPITEENFIIGEIVWWFGKS